MVRKKTADKVTADKATDKAMPFQDMSDVLAAADAKGYDAEGLCELTAGARGILVMSHDVYSKKFEAYGIKFRSLLFDTYGVPRIARDEKDRPVPGRVVGFWAGTPTSSKEKVFEFLSRMRCRAEHRAARRRGEYIVFE